MSDNKFRRDAFAHEDGETSELLGKFGVSNFFDDVRNDDIGLRLANIRLSFLKEGYEILVHAEIHFSPLFVSLPDDSDYIIEVLIGVVSHVSKDGPSVVCIC